MTAPTRLDAPAVSRRRGRLAVGVRLAPWLLLVLSLATTPARADQPADEPAAPPGSAAPEAPPPAATPSSPTPSSPKSLSERADQVGAIAIDVLLVRPPSLVYLGVGATYFAIVSPFMAVTRQIGDSFDRFVRTPYAYAVERPIGEF